MRHGGIDMTDKTPDRTNQDEAPTSGEMTRGFIVVAVVTVLFMAVFIWFVFSFVLLSCGTRPACG